jgi:adenine phosphoribosyltransferase
MNLKEYIRIVDNFPVIGVSFKDITPLLASHDAFSFAINTIAKKI